MSRSLFDLFTQLSISEQKDVREHVHYTLDPVTYIKEKFALLPRVQQEAFARLIEEHKVVSSVSPHYTKALYPQSSDEEDSSDQQDWKESSEDEEEDDISSDEEIAFRYDTRLGDALLDYPVNDHCSRCTCHENDDCACDRGCDHYYGTAEDLDRELNEIQEDYNRWYFATHYAKTVKGATRVVSPKRSASSIRRVAACPKVSVNAVPKAFPKASPIISKILLPAPPTLILPRVPTLPSYQ